MLQILTCSSAVAIFVSMIWWLLDIYLLGGEIPGTPVNTTIRLTVSKQERRDKKFIHPASWMCLLWYCVVPNANRVCESYEGRKLLHLFLSSSLCGWGGGIVSFASVVLLFLLCLSEPILSTESYQVVLFWLWYTFRKCTNCDWYEYVFLGYYTCLSFFQGF